MSGLGPGRFGTPRRPDRRVVVTPGEPRVTRHPAFGPGGLLPFPFPREPSRIRLLRADDLLVAELVLHDLTVQPPAGEDDPATLLAGDDAVLVVELPPQHVTEEAFFKVAPKVHVEPSGGNSAPNAPNDQPAVDPSSLEDPVELPPVPSDAAGPSRLAFRVPAGTSIDLTTAAVLEALKGLALVVAANARPPARGRFVRVPEVIVDDHLVAAGEVLTVAEAAALGRARRGFRSLEARLGIDVATVTVRRGGVDAGLGAGLAEVDHPVGSVLPGVLLGAVLPVPAEPDERTTALELPWRLIVSPHGGAGWYHAATPQRSPDTGHTELWHMRLGPGLDQRRAIETRDASTTIRAIWTRDFDRWPDEVDAPGAKAADPTLVDPDAPTAGGNDIDAKSSPANRRDHPGYRMALTSRDRVWLVAQTANWRLRNPDGQALVPPAVDVDQLMLSSMGGWLDSRVAWDRDQIPEHLSLEEWRHLATLGRDQLVRVVYAGYLLPFGHEASLVKVTERRFDTVEGRDIAYLHQRMFVVVRERTVELGDTGSRLGVLDLDRQIPFTSATITTLETPPIDPPLHLHGADSDISDLLWAFVPHVGGTPFPFQVITTDAVGRTQTFDAGMVFVEKPFEDEPTQLGSIAAVYEADGRLVPQLGGQRVAMAPSREGDDTTFQVESMQLGMDVPDSGGGALRPRTVPVMRSARLRLPAVQQLSGATEPTPFAYDPIYLEHGMPSSPQSAGSNAGEVFLRADGDNATVAFAEQSDRSGALVSPDLSVTALSRRVGPVSGSPENFAAATYDPADVFSAALNGMTLLGVIPLAEVLAAVGLDDLSEIPRFVADEVDAVTALLGDLERLSTAAGALTVPGVGGAFTQAIVDAIDAIADAADDAATSAQGVATSISQTLTGGTPATPIGQALGTFAGDLATLQAALSGFPLPHPVIDELAVVSGRLAAAVDDVAGVVSQVEEFVQGLTGDRVLTARLTWRPRMAAWPANGSVAGIFDPDTDHPLTLAVELQQPTRPGEPPTAAVSCILEGVALNLIGASSPFLTLRIEQLAFVVRPGKKPDVTCELGDLAFRGVLEFVQKLKDLIPADGFSDPPAVEVDASGIRSSFSLALPTVAVGVFSLENIRFGAQLIVPFVGEPLSVRFAFCSLDDPFRLTVSLFGGGGFVALEVDPDGMRRLEAALEFGASVSLDFGVASGGVSVMAGIYFELETTDTGGTDATLEGYFRLRGEVDVLGLISASLELRLSLTYEFDTKKVIGRASLVIEVEVLFFSASVTVECERRFAGDKDDPSFAELMDPDDGVEPPWDTYCSAFAGV